MLLHEISNLLFILLRVFFQFYDQFLSAHDLLNELLTLVFDSFVLMLFRFVLLVLLVDFDFRLLYLVVNLALHLLHVFNLLLVVSNLPI